MFTIEVSLEEYHRMRQASNFLHFLQVCGVDDWDGYDRAMRLYEQSMEQSEEGGDE